MANYEIQSRIVNTTDQDVVDEMVDEVSELMRSDSDPRWNDAYRYAASYIDGLYDEFTPEIAECSRLFGRRIGAIALAYSDLQYGRDETTPRLYGGSAEQDVLATYHHSGHSRRFVRDMFRYHATRPGDFSDDDLSLFPVIGGFHDAKMGNGRGTDERQSALFAGRVLRALGGLSLRDVKVRGTVAAIRATTWDVKRAAQAADLNEGYFHMQQAAAVADLLPLFDRSGPLVSLSLIPEVMTMEATDNVLSKVALERGFDLSRASITDCMEFIDHDPDLGRVFGNFLETQPGFLRNFTPADLDLDSHFTSRVDNTDLFIELNKSYIPGRSMGALATYEVAKEYSFVA